jgi:hypothetical protein
LSPELAATEVGADGAAVAGGAEGVALASPELELSPLEFTADTT